MSWPFSPAATNLRYLTARPLRSRVRGGLKKLFSPRLDKLPGPCGGLPVSADPSRNLVLGGRGGGSCGDNRGLRKSFSIFPNGNVFEVDENSLHFTSSLQKTKGRSRGLAYTSQQHEQVNREPAWNLEERDEDASLLSGLRNKKRNKKREGTHPRKSDEPSRMRQSVVFPCSLVVCGCVFVRLFPPFSPRPAKRKLLEN